ncbi:MAG: magnesium transporter [Clostridiales bacterium]|nr:magnesium transporter [Clostridiales bacterium]
MQGLFEEELKVLLERVSHYIDQGDIPALQSFIDHIHSADLIEIIEDLNEEQRNILIKALDTEEAAEVLENIDSEVFSQIIRALTLKDKRDILDEMSHDDIADHLNELSDERGEEIMTYLDDDDADDVRELLIYDEDTAGGLMTTEFVSLEEEFTVAESILYLQKHAPAAETIYYLFVIDEYEKLSGVISLRDLIIGDSEDKVKELMNTRVISVNVSDDQEEVAKVVSKYDFLAIPVIDDFDHMKGIITVDDIIDILEEEATEDMYKFAGASELEADAYEEDLGTRIWNSIRSRLPWLIVTLFGGMLSASIIASYQDALDSNAILAIFIPILAGMGGNVGTQSSTITVRNIAVGNITGIEVWKTIIHEMSVGLSVGLFCSTIALFASFFIYDISPGLAVVVGLAMWANMFVASTIGTVVPLIFKKIGVDPAVASAPFITMTIDLTGLTIYFTLVVTLMKNMI